MAAKDQGFLVPIVELSAALGCNAEDLSAIVKGATGVEIERAVAEDWGGRPSVPVEIAADALRRTLAAREAHSAKWASYQEYLARREADAAAERERIAREAREAEQRRARALAAERAEQAARETEARIKQEQERAAQRRGNPVPFEKFTGA